jgi:transposase-like protein
MNDSSGIVCPRCGSDIVERVRRSFFEKLITKKRKYCCHHCKKKFLKKSLLKNCVT